ncbi:MAG: hypothetical protein WCP73_09115 [Eubacteriales bacterium]
MARKVKTIKNLSVTTTAQDVTIAYNPFFIVNNSASVVYIKEKNGVDATSTNAFAIPANTIFQQELTMDTMSIIGAGTSPVALMFTEIG